MLGANTSLLPFLLKILFICERHREREGGTDTGRGRSRLQARGPMWDLNPGLQDHTLGRKQTLNR